MGFPKVTFEKHEWESHLAIGILNTTERRLVNRTYESAVLEPICNADVKLNEHLQKLLLSAVENITEFNNLIVEKSIAMPTILLRSESASSSQIERLTASAKNISIAELGKKTKDNAELVARNIRAMRAAVEGAKEVSNESILKIHKTLLESYLPEDAGKYRNQQVWIGSSGNIPHTARYVAPYHTKVQGYMDDLIRFTERDDIHPLIMASIAHAQFETIHPFIDGNGRTGRALIQSILANNMVTARSVLPISAGLLASGRNYYDALEDFREGRFEPIVECILESSIEAVSASWSAAYKIENLKKEWNLRISARRDSAIWGIVALLFEQPVIDVKWVQNALGITNTATRHAVDRLETIGIVKQVKDQKRNVLYQADEVTEIMDDFGKSIGTRGSTRSARK
jgi:Fic family protein